MALNFTESEIQFIINELTNEHQLDQIDISQHQGEFFLIPDISIPLYVVDTLPSPSIDYFDRCYIPKDETVFDTYVFPSRTIYMCEPNTDANATAYPYMWKPVLNIISEQTYKYEVIAEIDDIPGI